MLLRCGLIDGRLDSQKMGFKLPPQLIGAAFNFTKFKFCGSFNNGSYRKGGDDPKEVRDGKISKIPSQV